jgi:hypothetical protein
MPTSPDTIKLSWKEIIKTIAEKRPDLKDRLPDPESAPTYEIPGGDVPREGLTQAIGFSRDSYRPWENTLLDAIDQFVEIEKVKGWRTSIKNQELGNIAE